MQYETLAETALRAADNAPRSDPQGALVSAIQAVAYGVLAVSTELTDLHNKLDEMDQTLTGITAELEAINPNRQ